MRKQDDSARVGTIMPLNGRVDATTVGELRDRLHAAVDGGAGVMVLDLTEVDRIDATGLAMLVGTHRRALGAGRRLILRGTPRRVERLLGASGLGRVLLSEPAEVA
jgi:anti-sigma B factor antagonist